MALPGTDHRVALRRGSARFHRSRVDEGAGLHRWDGKGGASTRTRPVISVNISGLRLNGDDALVTAFSVIASLTTLTIDREVEVTQVRLRLLGESLIEIGQSTLEPSASHIFALLLYLAIERGKLIPRTALAGLFFPDASLATAAHNLRQLVYRLRQKEVPLECTLAAVMLPESSVTGAPEAALTQSYAEALNDSPRRVLLPGYHPPTRPLIDWLESYRDKLSHRLQSRLARDLHRARQGADWFAVERFARSLLEIDPLNETATLGLAEAIARTGSKQRAVQLLHDYAEDVGLSHQELTLPSRFLTRRISEDVIPAPVTMAPLVGRASEMRQLADGWSLTRTGICSGICVSGEKSIGKSRVLDELAALVRLDGSGVVLVYRATPGDRERPMSFFSDMCRRLLALPGGAGCSPESLQYVQRLIGAPVEGSAPTPAEIDAHVSHACTRRAILDLLDSVASERPVLFCIDDVDCLDTASFELLASLPDLATKLPACFVFSCPSALLPQLTRSRVVRLPPLSFDDSRELAQRLCSSLAHELSTASLDWCLSVAAGNPGHLELLIRHVAALRDTPTFPPSLVALLEEQLQSLPASARHLLLACAVFGNECTPDVLTALTGLDGYDLLSALELLIVRGLVVDSVAGVTCRNSLTAERVLSSAILGVTSLLHRRAAEHLERTADVACQSQSVAWRTADHWQAAGDHSRSLRWRQVCWRQLISIGQPLAAAESIRSHLAFASSLQERARLLDLLADSYRCASDVGEQLAALDERRALSDRIADSSTSRLAIAADIAEARFFSYDDTTAFLPELRALLRSPGLDDERRLRIARILIITADSILSEPLAREALEAVSTVSDTSPFAALLYQTRIIYHSVYGDRRAAEEQADLLLAIADKQELSPSNVSSHLTASLALRIVTNRQTDVSHLSALFDRCLAASMLGAAIRISGRLGSLLHEDGDLEQASFWCKRTTELIAKTGQHRVTTDYLTLRVDLALAEGDLSLARQFINVAPSQFPMYATPKWHNAYLAYCARVDQYEGRDPFPAERLDALLRWHEAAKHLSRHDDHMEVLWTALRDVGRAREASILLHEYLHVSRREVRPCIYALRARAGQDPALAALASDHNAEMAIERV